MRLRDAESALKILRKPVHKIICEGFQLFIRDLEELSHTCEHRFCKDLHGLDECDICQFIRKDIEELTDGTPIFIFPLFRWNEFIAGKNNCYMCSHGCIGKVEAFFLQIEVPFAGFVVIIRCSAVLHKFEWFLSQRDQHRSWLGQSSPFVRAIANTDYFCRRINILSMVVFRLKID